MKNFLEMPIWTSQVHKYFEVLYKTNQKIIELSGYEANRNWSIIEDLFVNISQNICKLVPYYMDRNERKIHLSERDEGIFCFKSSLLFLECDYKDLFKSNYDTFLNIKVIRSKSEHSLHEISFDSCYSGSTSLPEIVFNIKQELVEIKTEDIIKIIIDINNLFDKIRLDLIKIATDSENVTDYIIELTHFSFSKFNKILSSDMLKDIGRVTRNF